MKARFLIAALLATASTGTAIAQEYVTPDAGFVSTRSRAEVQAEVAQARRAGTLEISEHAYPALPSSGPVKSRAEVLAELEQARRDGTLDVPDADYPKLKLSGTPRTREEVQAEIREARENGTLDFSDTHYPLVRKNIMSGTDGHQDSQLR